MKLNNIRFYNIIIAFLAIVVLTSSPFDVSAQTRQRKKTVKKTTVQSNNSNSSPKTSEEAKKLQEAVQKEIKLTEQRIKDNDLRVSKELAALNRLDVEISATTNKINQLNKQVTKLDEEITEYEGNIDGNEKDLEKLREEYMKAVKKMRVKRKNQNDLAFIFSSNSLNQALRRMRYMKEFSGWQERQTEEINSKIKVLTSQKESLAKAKREREIALLLQKRNKDKLASQHSRQEILVSELQKDGKTLEGILKRKQTEVKEIDNMMSLLIAEEQKKAAEEARKNAEELQKRKAEQEKLLAQENNNQSTIKGKQGEVKKERIPNPSKQNNNTEYADARKRTPRSANNDVGNLSGLNQPPKSFLDLKGQLPYPSTGSFIVTSKFGRQNVPDMKDVEFDNPGIDAETDLGASAKAVYRGKVSGVYRLPGYNTVVILNHGSYYTVYGNITKPSVKTGDLVDSGALLGALAPSEVNSGRSVIHFEVWKNREKLNPQEWLR